MARLSRGITVCLLLAAWAGSAHAQEEDQDLTLPPRIDSVPGDPHLEPPPQDREDMLEAVVTGGQEDWRLPDLGTSFRSEAEKKPSNQRIEVSFLRLYDPEHQDPTEALFPGIEEERRVGFLKIIEVRFGHRD